MTADLVSLVCFANAQLPDSDYRVAFARTSQRCNVTLALPERPSALEPSRFERLPVGPGLDWRSILHMLRVPLILRRHRADYALFFATQLSTFGPTLARLMGVAPIITVTGLGRSFDETTRSSTWLRALYLVAFRVNARLCPHILFQNGHDLARLRQHLTPDLAARCTLIGSGIDLSYFTPSTVATETTRIIMVARLLPEKGVQDFIDLATSLSERADFVLVGPQSKSHPELLDTVRDSEREHLLTWLGRISSAAVRDALSNSTLLVLPSRSEGLPRVALEAILSDVAVVAYDIPGCRAALGPKYPLVPIGDTNTLASMVSQLIEDPCARSRIIRLARKHIVSDLSSEAYISRLEELIL